jgi:hypothetical protein
MKQGLIEFATGESQAKGQPAEVAVKPYSTVSRLATRDVMQLYHPRTTEVQPDVFISSHPPTKEVLRFTEGVRPAPTFRLFGCAGAV